MVTYNELVSNVASANKPYFKQKLQWSKNRSEINYLPQVKAPYSTVVFWVNRLKLQDRDDIIKCDQFGYSNLNELVAEMKGLYSFYEIQRYVV